MATRGAVDCQSRPGVGVDRHLRGRLPVAGDGRARVLVSAKRQCERGGQARRDHRDVLRGLLALRPIL